MDLLVWRVLKVIQETQVFQVCQDHLVRRVRSRLYQDLLVHQGVQEAMDLPDHQDHLDYQVHWGLLVILAEMGYQDLRGRWDVKVTGVYPASQVQEETKVPLVQKECKALLGHRA